MITDQKKLRAAVNKRLLRQKEVADQIGINNVYFNQWLNSKKDVSGTFVIKINEWLDSN